MIGSWYYNLLLLIACMSFCTRGASIIGGIIEFKHQLEKQGKTNITVGFDCWIVGAALAYIIWYITQH